MTGLTAVGDGTNKYYGALVSADITDNVTANNR